MKTNYKQKKKSNPGRKLSTLSFKRRRSKPKILRRRSKLTSKQQSLEIGRLKTALQMLLSDKSM